MKTFKDVFNSFIEKETEKDIKIISDLCLKMNIDPSEWFKHYIERDTDYFTGIDFLSELLDKFLFYIQNKFDECMMKYIPESGSNIFGEPYLSIDYEIVYNKDGLNIKKYKNISRFIKKNLTISQKEDLMKNILFSYIVNETNLEIYSKKDIRYLKLKKLSEPY